MRHPVFCTECGGRRYAANPRAALRWHRQRCSRGSRPATKTWPRSTKSGFQFWSAGNGRGLSPRDTLWDQK